MVRLCAAESVPHLPTMQPTSVMGYDDLRARLRRHLSQAMRDRDRVATAVLRDAIAALDNAEAVDPGDEVVSQVSEHVAGGVVGLGAAEAERRLLDAETQRAICKRKSRRGSPPQRRTRNAGKARAADNSGWRLMYCLPCSRPPMGATRARFQRFDPSTTDCASSQL